MQPRSDEDIDIKERAKGPFARFFNSGWSHLVRLMAVNVLFIVFNIPSILLSYFLSFIFLPVMIPAFNWEKFIVVTLPDGSSNISYELFMLLVVFFVTFVVSSLLVCIGPFQAGFCQVYKDIRNGTSFSLFGSFKTGLKDNWKKSLASMFIGLVVTLILLLAISFYLNMKNSAGTVIGAVFVVLLIAFVLIQNFAYNLMVYTDLKLGKIYKNAILFVLLRFVPCLGAALVVIIFNVMIPFVLLMSASYLTLGVFVFLYSFLVISWVQYFLAFYSASLIERYVADNKSSGEIKEKS